MKKKIFASLSLALAALFAACNQQAGAPPNAVASNAANASKPAAPVDTAAVEADVKKTVAEYAAGIAKNDVTAFDKATADNFMFVGNDGVVSTKAERLESMQTGATKYESLTYDDLMVRVRPTGDGAIVIGKATVKGMNMGKPIDGAMRVTQVWMKTNDGWKMVTLQATAMTAKAEDKKADEKKPDEKKAEDKAAGNAPSSLSNK
jgi:ketosteroid isomerase-like protein